jgi:glutamyl/glutaminyl-tRNA synthetase
VVSSFNKRTFFPGEARPHRLSQTYEPQVLRAEEHLPNTLRQMLVYQALGFEQPQFGHMSLILAPDKSKLSKRHGATSVGDFKEQGYLPEAMVNYLSMLGWNDGSEKEIYTVRAPLFPHQLPLLSRLPSV